MKIKLTILTFLIVINSVLAQQLFINIGDLRLNNDKVIEDCRIGYRTFGELNGDSSNVIIFPTWFEGKSEHLETLLKKYEFIDTTKFFVIAIDALGNSVSTSPSNRNRSDFPEFTINDMVNSQYKMLTEFFGLNNIHAIVGGSMGAMQAFEWAVAYPSFAKKIIPYVGTPQLTSFDLMLMNIMLDIIEQSFKFNIPEERTLSLVDKIMISHAYTPEYRVENTPRKDFGSFMERFEKKGENNFPLIDFYYQMKAMQIHDIARKFNGSMEKVSEIIEADMLVIPSLTDMLVNPIPSVKFAEITNSEIMKLNNYCGHIAVNCDIDKVKERIARFLIKNNPE